MYRRRKVLDLYRISVSGSIENYEGREAGKDKCVNGKKVTFAFLISLLLDFICIWVIKRYDTGITDNLVLANFLSEATVLVPGLIFVFASKEKFADFMGFRKIKPGTMLAIIPYAMFTMPLIVLFNLISQFFADNAVVSMMSEYNMAELPFIQLFFTLAVFAPLCEEMICRGVYYQGCKKSGSAFGAMLFSSLLFGLMHMNINQAVYALVMGVLAVLLVEATGSLWASVIYHGLINGSQAILMYGMLKQDPGIYTEVADTISTDLLVYGVAVYLLIAAICLPLGWGLLVWMGEHENRSGVLRQLWNSRKKKES